MNSPPVRFEALFAEQAAYVMHSLRRLGVREADLEDLTQDVFLAVHHRLSDYDPNRPTRPWLFAFAFRAASNYRRLARHRRELSSDVPEDAAWQPAPQERDLELARRRELLHRALQELDLPHRATVVLCDLDGAAPKDAADVLSIPINTVYSRLRTGRRKLSDAVASLRRQDGARHA